MIQKRESTEENKNVTAYSLHKNEDINFQLHLKMHINY